MPHTPGPWIIRERTVGHPRRRFDLEIVAPLDGGRMEHPICRIPSGFTNQDEDAALLAAAPELLAEVERLHDNLTAQVEDTPCDAGNWDGGSPETCEHCQARIYRDRIGVLIGKATGEPERIGD